MSSPGEDSLRLGSQSNGKLNQRHHRLETGQFQPASAYLIPPKTMPGYSSRRISKQSFSRGLDHLRRATRGLFVCRNMQLPLVDAHQSPSNSIPFLFLVCHGIIRAMAETIILSLPTPPTTAIMLPIYTDWNSNMISM